MDSTGFITNTTVAHSLYQGISSGWRGQPPVDFVTSNTFEDIVGCKVTNPQPAAGCSGFQACAL